MHSRSTLKTNLKRAPRNLEGLAVHKTRKLAPFQPSTSAGNVEESRELELMAAKIRKCILCPLYASRTIAVPGKGPTKAKVMIIGEGPGKKEDETGEPFVGSSGRYLDHVLEGTGFNRGDFFITNIVKCRPPNNRTPRSNEVQTCTSVYLFRQIELVDPKIIVLLGGTAVKTMLGLPNVEAARGKVLEKGQRCFIATYHPAVRFHREDLAQKLKADFGLLKKQLQKL